MLEVTEHRVALSDVELSYLACGQGPLVVCLHGFPDVPQGMVPTLQALAAAGYRTVAPYLRGYAPSGLSRSGDYRITTVAEDVAALASAEGAKRFAVVGHDWGAVTSYVLASAHPDRVAAVVAASIPPLRRFLLGPSLKQLHRSRYMLRFQLRGRPEALIARDDYAWLRGLIREWSPDWAISDAQFDAIKAALSPPGHLSAALAYYRALPGMLTSRANWRLFMQPLRVPFKLIHGGRDGCVGAEMFVRAEHCFAAHYERLWLDAAGHFLQYEQPQRFADEVLSFMRQHFPPAGV